MRNVRATMIAVVLATLIPGSSGQAAPSFIPKPSAWNVASGKIEKVDYWRRYYRRHGNDWRPYYRPTPPPAAPVRPLSCGEFRFWDGERCVDVRFR
jgi:hypothetical protein